MKRILSLFLLCLMLVGCSKAPTQHDISLDQLMLTLPGVFVAHTGNDLEADFAYSNDKVYIHGFREEKQEILQYYDSLSLESYVRMLAESFDPMLDAQITNEIWNYTYTAELDGEDYTFLCAFYETEESFWRVQASCPTTEFAENQQILWEYISAAA